MKTVRISFEYRPPCGRIDFTGPWSTAGRLWITYEKSHATHALGTG